MKNNLLLRFCVEDGSSNSTLFFFAGIVAEITLLIDVLCIIAVTGGLKYGFEPFGSGCIIGAGCLLLMVLCGFLLCREEQMTYYIISAVISIAAAAAMLIFRENTLDFCQQVMTMLKSLNKDFTSVASVQ